MKPLILLLLLLQGVVHAQTSINIPACASCPSTASTGFGGLGAGCLTGDGTIKIVGTDAHYYPTIAWSADNRLFRWGESIQTHGGADPFKMYEFQKVPTGFNIKKAKINGGSYYSGLLAILGTDGRLILSYGAQTVQTTPSYDPVVGYDTQTFYDVSGKIGGSTGIQDFTIGWGIDGLPANTLISTIVITNEGDAYLGPGTSTLLDIVSGGYHTYYDNPRIFNLTKSSATAWTKVPRIPGTKYTRVWSTTYFGQVYYEVQNTTTGAYDYYSAGQNENGLLMTTDARVPANSSWCGLDVSTCPLSTIAYTSAPARMDKLPARTTTNGKIDEFFTKSLDYASLINEIPINSAASTAMVAYRVSTNEVYAFGNGNISSYGVPTGPTLFNPAANLYDEIKNRPVDYSDPTGYTNSSVITETAAKFNLPPGVTEVYDVNVGYSALLLYDQAHIKLATNNGIWAAVVDKVVPMPSGYTGFNNYVWARDPLKPKDGSIRKMDSFFSGVLWLTADGNLGATGQRRRAGGTSSLENLPSNTVSDTQIDCVLNADINDNNVPLDKGY